jgi:GNAT superfamily N-acetyltransferase
MRRDYQITSARPHDIHLLPAIELAAGVLLRGHAPLAVLTETTSVREFRAAQRAARLWVALKGDTPVGFAQAEVLGSHEAHLKEIDVHPTHGRRGLGARLVAAVCDWAARSGYQGVTLTTFRDIPWNMPFYARLGFEAVPASELTAELHRVVEDETRRGLDPVRRVVMRRLGSTNLEAPNRWAGICEPNL